MVTKFKYIGDGGFVPGLPARDLTDDDLRELAPELRAILDEHMALDEGRIYEAAEKPPRGEARPAASSASAANEGE